MAKRVFAALVLLGVLLAGYWVYTRYATGGRLRDGEVVMSDDGTPVKVTPNDGGSATEDAAAGGPPANGGMQSQSLAPLQPPQPRAKSAPATDTQAPNAPNGAAFAGSGRFQVYRQGNLTWRIDTENGSTCILFATNEEWRKPDVYSRGCPNS